MRTKKYFHVSGKYVATLSMYGKEYEITLRANQYAAHVEGRIARELVECSSEWKEVIEVFADEVLSKSNVCAALAQAQYYFSMIPEPLRLKPSVLLEEFSNKVLQYLKPSR